MHLDRRLWHRFQRSIDVSGDAASLYGAAGNHWIVSTIGIVLIAIACGAGSVLITGALGDRPVFILALPLAVALVVWSIVGPEQLFVVLVLTRATLNPIFDIARLPVFGGLGALLNIVVICLAIAMAVRGKYRVPSSVWKTWVPFMLVIAIGVVRSPDPLGAQRDGAVLVTYGAVYYSAFFLVRDRISLDRMLRWLLLSAIPVFFYTIANDVVLGRIPDGRLRGPFAHPNLLGFYCVILLAAWLAKTRTEPDAPLFNVRAIAWWSYLGGLGLLLAGTQARGAWVGASVLFVAYAVLVRRSYLFLLVGVAVVAATVPVVRDRLIDLMSNNEVGTYATLNSLAWREYLWRSAIAVMTPMSYLIGNGIGSFSFDSIRFFPLAGGFNWGAHNVYMQLLYDDGIPGLISFGLLFVVPAMVVWKNRTLAKSLRTVALALIPSFAFMCYGDNMLAYSVVNWNFWFVVGAIASVAQQESASAPAQVDEARPERAVRRTAGVMMPIAAGPRSPRPDADGRVT